MYSAIIFLPLLGAMAAGLFGRWMGDRAARWVTTGALMLAAVLAAVAFVQVALGGQPRTVEIMRWVVSGNFEVTWALRYDTLSAVMVAMVTAVSSMIHLYSFGYMAHDKSIPRFFAYLSLFTFFMLMLVTADNFLQMFFGWEGVGLASYLLIGFWYDRPSANAAAIKAFLVNRVGDFGFALGIFGVFLAFNAVSFDAVFQAVPAMADKSIHFLGLDLPLITTLCLLLFIGAMGKSAQLGLHTWLPDAMEGPTPVSALIHAATMVTAGVFMVCRLSPMFEYSETALAVVTIVGASTAIFAASIGLVQTDIKRVIAYSTCSQLGYMFFAAGVSAYSASMFHLTTHAFFKALLFLGAGSVIHAMSDEQDMREMGGIWRKIPLTYGLMWIGSLALAGIPLFAGYYSKDLIIEAAYAAHSGVGLYAFWMGVIAAALTAFYSWRLLFMTFHGAPRADEQVMSHIHESPLTMTLPMCVLALGAVFSGMALAGLFTGEGHAAFWGASIFVGEGHTAVADAHHVPGWVKLLPIGVAIGGIVLAWVFYIAAPGLPGALAARFQRTYLFLLNKWYFDELYDRLFVNPAKRIGRSLWLGGDGSLIDGVGPDGIAAATLDLARRAARLQSGYVYHYAFAMLVGVAALVTLFLFSGGGIMTGWPLLSLTIFLPLVGAGFILLIRGEDEVVARNARNVALWTSLITFILALMVWANFDPRSAAFQLEERADWVPELKISYHVGVDGISVFFVLLSAFLTPLCVLASWQVIRDRVKEYMIAFLVLETLMIGMFCALDMVLFYLFFEGVLIPMFLIIGVWGGPRRVYSAFKFFLYTLTGSVLMLIAILAMAYTAGTTDIPELMKAGFPKDMQFWLWLAFFASFAVKVPMWPLHTWLPDAHVEAPTAGSVILAGVLLKMGGYGFLRFSLPMMPLASDFFTPLIFTLSVIAVIYTSLVALAQEDMKKLIAYSSVAHMGFVTIGIFTFNVQGIEGAIFQMLSHGIVSAALFLCVGVVYDRMHSRLIATYGGLVHRMPAYAAVFMVFMLASAGLPGTSGFVGEILVLVGAFQANTWVAALASIGVILGAAYMLWLYRRVIFGELTKDNLKSIVDLDKREIAIFAPLVLAVLWMGIYPSSFLDAISVSAQNLADNYAAALKAAASPVAQAVAAGGAP